MASITLKASGRWMARVSMNGAAHSIGTFATEEEAKERAAIFENEIKPHLLIPNLGKQLENEINDWKKTLKQFEGLKDVGNLKNDYSLEIITIENIILKLESSMKVYTNQKNLQEEAKLERVSQMISGN